MGNTNSLKDSVNLAFDIEKYKFDTGEDLNGKLKTFKYTEIGKYNVFVEFKGKEITHWEKIVEEKKENKIERVVEMCDGKNKVIKLQILALDNESMIFDTKNDSFEFKFTVPENIPSSFSYNKGTTFAKIEYRLKAKLINEKGEKIKTYLPIKIRQSKPYFISNLFVTKYSRLKTWGFKNQGLCKLKLFLEKDTFLFDKSFDLILEIDNSESKLEVNKLVAKITRHISLTSSYSSQSLIENIIYKSILLNINPNTKEVINLQLDIASAIERPFESYSIKGKIIECQYNLEIRVYTNGILMCLGDSTQIKSLVKLVPKL